MEFRDRKRKKKIPCSCCAPAAYSPLYCYPSSYDSCTSHVRPAAATPFLSPPDGSTELYYSLPYAAEARLSATSSACISSSPQPLVATKQHLWTPPRCLSQMPPPPLMPLVPCSRFSTSHSTPPPHLPSLPLLSTQLQLEILSWLPATSVIRFRTVCRAWNTATRDYSFTMTHFKKSCLFSSPSQRNKLFPTTFLVHYFDKNDSDSKLNLEELLSPAAGGGNIHSRWVRINQINSPQRRNHRILNTCNGLVLAADYTEQRLLLYNPLTRNEVVLPTDPDNPYLIDHEFTGLGFNADTSEYKVVKLFINGERPAQILPICAYVCTVTAGLRGGDTSTGQACPSLSWRLTSYVSQSKKSLLPTSTGVLANGRLHWLWLSKQDRIRTNVWSFDLQDEQFKEVPIEVPLADHPQPPWEPPRVQWRVTTTTGGRLALLAFQPQWCSCQAYVMMEYGVGESWSLTSSFTMRQPLIGKICDAQPRSLLADDGRSLMVFLHEYIFFFDSETQQEAILHKSRIAECAPSFDRNFFVEPFTGNLI